MNEPSFDPAHIDESKPRFLVGVTGHMNLDGADVKSIQQRLRLIFRFLRFGGAKRMPSEPRSLGAQIADQVAPQTTPDSAASKLHRAYCKRLEAFKGMGDTPIIVMSNLAPGADSVSVDVAIEKEFQNIGFSVLAPLPFPTELYRDASTFAREGKPRSGNKQRQGDFDDLLSRIGSENTFCVKLDSDRPLSSQELNERLQLDLKEKERRRERYYAAGEFLADYSNLLIAIWDGSRPDKSSTSGTDAVVKARLSGTRPGLLPTSHGLRLANGGPTIHIATDTTQPPSGAGEESMISSPPLRFLHPFHADDSHPTLGLTRSGLLPEADEASSKNRATNINAREQLLSSLSMFLRQAELLSTFNAEPKPGVETYKKDFEKIFQLPAASKPPAPDDLGPDAPADEVGAAQAYADYRHQLARLSMTRTRATTAGRGTNDPTTHHVKGYAGESDQTIIALFLITFVAAAMLHIYAHWEPHHECPPEAHGEQSAERKSETSHEEVKDVKQPEKSDHTPSSLRHDQQIVSPQPHWLGRLDGHTKQLLDQLADWIKHLASKPLETLAGIVPKITGVLALAFSVIALLFYTHRRSRLINERWHDYRSLAEGLRVQFHWARSGLAYSVSANYMRRQRSELNWIRAAIRSVAIPYEQWQYRFDQLKRKEQLNALESVKHRWVIEQRDYFLKRFQEKQAAQHNWHSLGKVFSIAGLGMAAVCVAEKLHVTKINWVADKCLYILAASLVPLVAAWILRRFVDEGWTQHPPEPREKKEVQHQMVDTFPVGDAPAKKSKQRLRVGHLVHQLLHWLVPTSERNIQTFSSPLRRDLRLTLGFMGALPVAMWIATAGLCLAALPGHLDLNGFPTAKHLATIFFGICLLFGAMCVAWSEKQLHGEHAYQYHAMHALFSEALQRLESALDQMKEDLEDPIAFARSRQQTQDILYHLGKESLDENAEWLLLHRSRPLEPVFAG